MRARRTRHDPARDHGLRRRSSRWSPSSSTAPSTRCRAARRARRCAPSARAKGARRSCASCASSRRPSSRCTSRRTWRSSPARPRSSARARGTFDRVDFAAFAHRRIERDAHESDQCEVGYFVVARSRRATGRWTSSGASRRRSTSSRRRAASSNVVAEDVEEFDVKYLDPLTGAVGRDLGLDAGDRAAQPAPARGAIRLVLKGVGDAPPYDVHDQVMLPMQQPLTFGIPR